MIGRTLAHYEIIEKLGQGGMGEVYRARDTKLGREVAIKLLPSEFSQDSERLARFQREATTLAKLQHTNIASIYGFEQDGQHRILVMELVEGEELADRLRRGPLPIEEAIDVALQLAEGLEVAHAQGIVHRDLKPANIKINATRDVKILDFGLARAYAADPASGGETQLENSPTITAAMTQAGVILGTAAYMSPEQARGKSIDKQSDIWSFGVVLYEMLTGDQLYGGETISDSIGAILHREPDLEKLVGTPPALQRLVLRCLQRDRRQRLRDIGDAKLELQEATTEKVVARAATVSSNRIGRIAATILAAAAVALGWLYVSKPAPPRSGVTTIGMPRDQFLHYGQQGSWAQFDISPDGKYVVYVGGDDRILFLRETNSFEVRSISEMFCSLPRFSPDGTWIAFFAQSRLWKVAVSGGAPIEVCETTNGGGLGWGPEDFYFPTNNGSAIWTAPIAGGEAQPLSKLDDAAHETSHRWPDVLPGGRHALFTIKTADIETLSDAAIGILDLETGEHTVLLRGGTDARYVPTGHIVYGRDSQLFAVPFDVETLSLEGTPVQVLDDIHVASMNGSAHARLSATGDLAYIPDTEIVQSHELVWVELTGKTTRLEIADAGFLNLALAPDGSKFSGMKTAANDKIWIYDLRRRTTSRLTSTPGNDLYSVWSPDGSLIVYSNDRGGGQDLFLIPADGSAPAQKIVEGPEIDFAGSWSPDGSILVFNRVKADGDVDLWTVSMDGAYETTPFLATEYGETTPEFSPDGQWILYVSDITGESALYLRPFPGPGTATRVSAGRSFGGRWSPDGGTVYYDEGGAINAVTIDPSSGEIGEPEVLIVLGDEYFGEFPLHPDGTRFLANRLDIEDTRQYQIRLVFDWTERLRSLN